MAISQYWVGQIPSQPIAITVYDSFGQVRNLASYSGYRVKLVDPHNNEVDLTGSVLQTSGASEGRFVFRWPTDRSLFEKTGEYLLQLEIDGNNGSKDYTTEHSIKVRRLGGNS